MKNNTKSNGIKWHALFTIIFILVFSQKALPQNMIRGKVVSQNGDPIVGASVVIRGSLTGTTTDETGSFTINAQPTDVLVFSYVGFVTKEIEVQGRSDITETLTPSTTGLDEVVVIGYGTQKKKDLTGAVERVDLSEVAGNPDPSLGKFLHGTIPGLNVGATTTAGADPSISIRGQTTISGSNSPLIVLDGIIFRGNLVDINPSDIASIDVLKDASAAAIYGSQASNGVILITTKEGNRGGPNLNYSYSYTLQRLSTKKMLPLDAKGFLQRLNDRYLTESRLGPDLLEPNPDWDPSVHFADPSVSVGIQEGLDNNYWKLLTNENPFIQNHNVNVSGGGERTTYFVSFGALNQKNMIMNDTYKRFNYRANLNMKITDWFDLSMTSFYTSSDYSGVSPSAGDIVGLPPQVPYKDADGNYILQVYNGMLNPFLQMQQSDLNKRGELNGIFSGNIKVPFIPGLSYRLNFSESLNSSRMFNFNQFGANFQGTGDKSNGSTHSYTLDNIVNYNRTLDAHSIDLTLVYGMEKIDNETTTAHSQNFNSFVLGYNNLGQGASDLQSAGSSAYKETSLYEMGRLTYTYKDRYILTSTVRRDGFSGFGEAHKFGVFPSFAVAWRLSEENFIKNNVSIIDNLKLRVSYGSNGNRTVGRYQTLSRIQSSVGNGYLYGVNGTPEIGQFISSLSNENLRWETTNSFNVGVDFGLLDDRLTGSVDVYNARTHDLLYNVNIPQINGFGSIATNLGKLKNTGEEISITGRPIVNKNWEWNVTLNFSRNRNEVLSIFGPDSTGKEEDLISSNIFIGKPLNTVYDFHLIGMWQMDDYINGLIPDGFTYGTYKIEDLDHSGNISADKDRMILGYRDPAYSFSVSNNLRYKNWNLSFLVNSVQGGRHGYMGQPGTSLPNPDNVHNWNSFNFDYWTPENPNARYRQLGFYTVAIGEGFSPYLQRSFVRLQDIRISHSFDKDNIKRFFVKGLDIYLSGSNLITISNWDGWDPETGTGLTTGAYPLLRTFTIGANISF